MRIGLLILPVLSSISCADLLPYHDDQAFEDVEYGEYPVQSFESSPEIAPRPNIITAHPSPDPTLYTFFEPRGWKVDRPGPMILDSDWNLVWTSTQWGNTYNHQVQRWRGEDYLTFWAGDDGIGGHGEGYMYMLDSSYRTVRRFGAQNGYMADQHSFKITEEGTILFTIYDTKKADLRSIGELGRSYIWDCLFQEVDIDTGRLVFEWRASDHISFEASYDGQGGTSYWDPWDWFHLNSVDKDAAGNYLVSARYTHALHYISGEDGSILWELGGRRNSFKDISDGRATNFCYQHDARWRDNQTKISLYDNHAENHHPDLGHTRGLLLGVDLSKMTVELLVEYRNAQDISCVSQGSMQVLDSKDVFIGYGYCGALTQFSENGTVIEDVHIGPQREFAVGNIQSYRARKHHWKGLPATLPVVAIHENIACVSWNGATEVRTWELQHSDGGILTSNEDWEALTRIDKTGFETQLAFDDLAVKGYLRVMAFDASGDCLGTTKIVDWRFARTRFARKFRLLTIPSCVGFVGSIVAVSILMLHLIRPAIQRAACSGTLSRATPWHRRGTAREYSPLLRQSFHDEYGPVKES